MTINVSKNTRDGYHYNSKHWSDHFKALPPIKGELLEVLIGMILGDCTLTLQDKGKHAYIKFDQGYKQKEFTYHLFDLFKKYCFAEEVVERIERKLASRIGEIKSFWFRTVALKQFTELHSLFYRKEVTTVNGKPKEYYVKSPNLEYLSTMLTARVLAYWIMGDGSLATNRKTLIIHSQGFTYDENLGCSSLLNKTFGLSSKVISHKQKYWVIEIPAKDSTKLAALIDPYLIPSMAYKLPSSHV